MGGMTTPAFPTASGPITLEGPDGALEAHVDWPEDGEPVAPVTAVVCHPLPTEGGTMHNKVVVMAARSLRAPAISSYPWSSVLRRIGEISP